MESLDREAQPTRQVSSALAQTASGHYDQNQRKRDFSAANDEQCDRQGSSSGPDARGDEQRQQSCVARDIDASALPIGQGAPLSNGAAAPEKCEDGLDDGVKSAAPAAKKLKQGPTQFGATPGTAAPALEVPESCDPGGSLDNYCGRRGQDEMDVVESKGPPPQASSEIEAFPHQAVLDGMEGRADCKIVSLPQQLNIVPQIIYSLQSLLDSYNRETLDLTSHDVISAVEASRNVCSILLLDPEARAPLVGSLDKPLRLAQVLRHTTVLVDRTLHEVSDYLEEEEPRSRLATLDNTRPGGSCASPYEQLRLLKELLQEITRVSPQSTMQKKSGLLDVLCVLQARAASRTAPPTTTTYNLVEKPSSTEPVAAKPSSSTVAVLRSAPYTTMEPVCPPLPPVPPTSSSLGGTPSSTESVAPSSSLTNNVNPTSDTAASTKAYPSPAVLEELLRWAGFRARKDSSLGTTATVVAQISSAPDPQVLAELLQGHSFDLPDGSKALTKADVKKGDVFYTVQNGTMALCRVTRVHKGKAHVQDSTERSVQVYPGTLRVPCLNDVATFPPEDGPFTEEPLLGTPPVILLPPDDTIKEVVDGTRRLLAERDFQFGGFRDADRRRLQSPVETVSDALDRLPFVMITLDCVLTSISEDRARTIDQKSLKKFNSEVHSLVLLGAARSLLREWAEVPEHVKPPLRSAPVARPNNEFIVDGSRDRKKTKRLEDDPRMQASGMDQEFWRNVRETKSCSICAAAFTANDGAKNIWHCKQSACGKVFCSQCAGYGCATSQGLDSKWMCRSCKSAVPIDVVSATQEGGSLVHGKKTEVDSCGTHQSSVGRGLRKILQGRGHQVREQVLL